MLKANILNATPVKIAYRGAAMSSRHRYTPTHSHIETVESNIECQFLGQKTKLRVAKYVPTVQVPRTLMYRGRSYQA